MSHNLDNLDLHACYKPGAMLLDSPRSLEACARNGVRVETLWSKTLKDFLHESNGDKEIANYRYTHWQQRRMETIELLRMDRRSLIMEMNEPKPLRTGASTVPPIPRATRAVSSSEDSCSSSELSPRPATSGDIGRRHNRRKKNLIASDPVDYHRQQAKAKYELEKEKLRKQVEANLSRQRQAELHRRHQEDQMLERERKLREARERELREEQRLRKEIQERERAQLERQREMEERKEKTQKQQKKLKDQLLQQYQKAEAERLEHLEKVAALREERQAERREANLQKQQQIRDAAQRIAEKKRQEAEEKQQRAEEIRQQFERQREDEKKERIKKARARQRLIQERLQRSKEKEDELIHQTEEKTRRADEMLRRHEEEKRNYHLAKKVLEQEKEEKRKEHRTKSKMLEDLKVRETLEKQKRQEEAQRLLEEEKARQAKLKRLEKELHMQDRLEAVERMKLIHEYEIRKQREEMEKKMERVAEMEQQSKALDKERQRFREKMLRQGQGVLGEVLPGPGDYLGITTPQAVVHSSPAVSFGHAPVGKPRTNSLPGPASYDPHHDFVLPHHGAVRLPRRTGHVTGGTSPNKKHATSPLPSRKSPSPAKKAHARPTAPSTTSSSMTPLGCSIRSAAGGQGSAADDVEEGSSNEYSDSDLQ